MTYVLAAIAILAVACLLRRKRRPPASGWQFDRWTQGVTLTDCTRPCSVTATLPRSLRRRSTRYSDARPHPEAANPATTPASF